MKIAINLFILFSVYCHVRSLDNGLALTPPMGWLSWQRFRCLTDCYQFPHECISERLFRKTAELMVSEGYLDAGYEYVIIDDCWASKSRDADGRLQADPDRFPNGIKDLADYVHGLGLKLGIYGDYGTLTCAGYPGSIDHLELDAQTFAEWGIDYLKLDGCYVREEGMEQGYGEMSRYLNQTGRPIVFSCSFPAYLGLKANYSAAVEYCNLWRNYDDIDDSFDDVRDISAWFGFNQEFLTAYAGPGHWNDPDMLIIGNFGLSLEQSKTQMTIWSILAAPLIMSTDLEAVRPEFKKILLNKDAIRINQDPLGLPGYLASAINNINVWMKLIQGNGESLALAIGIVSNRTDGYYFPYNLTVGNYHIADGAAFSVKNVFEEEEHQTLKTVSSSENITVRVPPTGAVLLLLEPL